MHDIADPPNDQTMPARVKRGFGVALAGGGSKAAATSMGVLDALVNSPDWNKVDAIASVSGGGYAALWLYARLIEGYEADPQYPQSSLRAAFADCIPRDPHATVLANAERVTADGGHEAVAICPEVPGSEWTQQRFLRCRQNIFVTDCNFEAKGEDNTEYVAAAGMLVGSLITVIPNFVSSTVFDWPLNYAPSRLMYRRGIATAFALIPRSEQSTQRRSDIAEICSNTHFVNCDPTRDSMLAEERYTFDALDQTYARATEAERANPTSAHAPYWLINATSAGGRSLFSWATTAERDIRNQVFEMTPAGMCSRLYGCVDPAYVGWNLLDAVQAAAAFLDVNGPAIQPPLRLIAASSAHLLNLEWGRDLPNPNVRIERRVLHQLLPFPLYWLDGGFATLAEGQNSTHSSYIRVIDGGGADNTGAFSLLARKFRTVLISDHALDNKGAMEDICELRNALHKLGMHLHLPALTEFRTACNAILSDGRAGRDEKRYYPIWAWRQPVVVGCVNEVESDDGCQAGGFSSFVYLVKPALDLGKFIEEQYRDDGNRRGFRVLKCGADDSCEFVACEASAHLADAIFAKNRLQRNDLYGPHGAPRFPQHTTVGMTFDSSYTMYGAHKDLARQRTNHALRLIQAVGGREERLMKLAREQRDTIAVSTKVWEYDPKTGCPANQASGGAVCAAALQRQPNLLEDSCLTKSDRRWRFPE